MARTKIRLVARDAETGEFIRIADALNRPKETVIEKIKVPAPKK